MKERRKYLRINNKVKITCKVAGELGENNVYTLDISAGGSRIWMDKHVKISTLLELNMHLPDSPEPLFCMGRVIWQNLKPQKAEDGKSYYETGLIFENVTLKNRMSLIYYVHGKGKK